MSAAMTSMAAAPAMTSMYAQPQYAAAPTMTSMYATPGASMYMPGTTTMAAPTIVETVAAPTVFAAPTNMAATTTKAPSYVSAPSMVAAPVSMVAASVAAPISAFGLPQPVMLTQGMPDPATLDKEKVAYGQALEAQLKKQVDAVMAEGEIKKKMMEDDYKYREEQFKLQQHEAFKMACLQVDQECNTQCNGLREAAITQQTAVEERAAIQSADYTKKKCIEEYSVKSWELQKQWFEKETAFTQQYQQVMKKGSNAVITPALPAVGMPMMTQAPSYVAASAPVVTQTITAAPVVTETIAAAPFTYAQAPVSYAAAPVYETIAAAPTVMTAPTTMMAPTTFGTTTMMAAPATVI